MRPPHAQGANQFLISQKAAYFFGGFEVGVVFF